MRKTGNNIRQQRARDRVMTLTDEQKQEYIRSNGVICPYCRQTDQVDADMVQLENDNLVATVRCYRCNKAWKDIYKIADVEEIE